MVDDFGLLVAESVVAERSLEYGKRRGHNSRVYGTAASGGVSRRLCGGSVQAALDRGEDGDAGATFDSRDRANRRSTASAYSGSNTAAATRLPGDPSATV
jgi:hypothetical protein